MPETNTRACVCVRLVAVVVAGKCVQNRDLRNLVNNNTATVAPDDDEYSSRLLKKKQQRASSINFNQSAILLLHQYIYTTLSKTHSALKYSNCTIKVNSIQGQRDG